MTFVFHFNVNVKSHYSSRYCGKRPWEVIEKLRDYFVYIKRKPIPLHVTSQRQLLLLLLFKNSLYEVEV